MQTDNIIALDIAGAATPPTEFRIFARGPVKTRKGEFVFDEIAAHRVTSEAADFGNEFPLDYAHAMFSGYAPNPAEAHKAAGWFRPSLRNGELWATAVTWTESARTYLKNREYRYISPTFEHEDRRITRLLNVALTNVPATHGLEPLMAHSLREAAHERTYQVNYDGYTTHDGIEVPGIRELHKLGMTEERFLSVTREHPELLAMHQKPSVASAAMTSFEDDVPGPEVLARLGMTREAYVETARKIDREHAKYRPNVFGGRRR
jgi:hypothetical protein